jgi:murein L,D-transpeptidase YcbB/YkuD
LCRIATSGNLATLGRPDFSEYRTRVESFYQAAGDTLTWTRRGAVTDQARTLIETLQAAEGKGLNAEDYDGSRWAPRLARLSDASNPQAESDFAEFDVALTVSVMRYISDLHFGRVNPGFFHADVQAENDSIDVPRFLLQRLVDATDVRSVLEEIEPPYDGYRRTERALQRYIAMAQEDHVGPLAFTQKTIEPGGSYPAAAQLADRLRQLGDLPIRAPLDPNSYSGPLVDALKHFQMRHGLDADGRIGRATIAQLNTPLSDRIRQLRLTLERWRWVPHGFPQPPIVVNVPEFVLRAASDSYRTELEMKVVVGAAYHHQTPVFMANLKEVVFRPYWNVPLSIQQAELVPKLDKDPSYLAKNRYEVVTPQNTFVSSGIADKATLAQLRSGALRIRQIPGPENALGLVAFMFPNEYDVYLHGTPAAQLFAKSRRDFSHGCIRAEKPQELAEWVLRNQPQWTPERIADAMNGKETIHVGLKQPIPVLIVYATAVVLEGGEVRFFEDIYGEDARLAKTLDSREKPTSAERVLRPRE